MSASLPDAARRDKEALIQKWREIGFIKNEAVYGAFNAVGREHFIAKKLLPRTYEDKPLPIGYRQTISQPSTVVRMLDQCRIEPGQRILEIGAGCGYQTALLTVLAGEGGFVLGLEIVVPLARLAKDKLIKIGSTVPVIHYGQNVRVDAQDAGAFVDGTTFDRIIVACACPTVPVAWVELLNTGGILLAPVGGPKVQEMTRVTRRPEARPWVEKLGPYRFVPLTGQLGY